MSTTIDTNVEGGVLTIDQAAAYLSIHRRRLCTRGGPDERDSVRAQSKLGGCLRYRRSDFDAWVAQHVESFDEDGAIPDQRSGGGISLSRSSRPR